METNENKRRTVREQMMLLYGRSTEIREHNDEGDRLQADAYTESMSVVEAELKELGRVEFGGTDTGESESLVLEADGETEWLDIRALDARCGRGQEKGPTAECVREDGTVLDVYLYDEKLMPNGAANAMSLLTFLDRYAKR